MRDTIDIGIDLGTTNSAIALAEGDTVTVIKNIESQDTTPSAVWMPRAGEVRVGAKARTRVESDPENTASEFKLEMGLADVARKFARAGVQLTPPQLSAEVLKTLRNDATRFLNDVPTAAVITVPAAFALNQNKATVEAATLAGFVPGSPLLQEPTAAAFAYGLQDTSDRAYWMVFDFGGGTFDAAVVNKRDGELRVLHHAGDPYLGGKLIDWALVERVLAPAAASEFGLSDFQRDNPHHARNFARLKAAAEEAKIALSGIESTSVLVELDTPGGDSETFDFTLTRGALDRVAEPYYVRAINLCREAIRENGLSADAIDKLLLVGGVTLSPGLRERLADPADGIGISLETRLDPSTVVARGAALFASTIRHPAPLAAAPAAGEFAVELSYEPAVTTTTTTVAGRLRAGRDLDWTGYSVVLANPEGRPPFRTANIALNRVGAFATEVDVDERRTSRFTVELIDPAGAPQKLVPNTLSITHRTETFGGARLAHSLGIQLADKTFSPLLRKGAGVPTTAHGKFRTSYTLLRRDDEAMIRIPVVQGERVRANRNRPVGLLTIKPVDLRMDLPVGTEVEVTFEVDASNLVTVVADVPLIGAQFEAEIDLGSVRTPSADVLTQQLAEAEDRYDVLQRSADLPDVDERLRRLEAEGTLPTVREQVRASATDAGAAATAEDRLRDFQAELDDIDDLAALPRRTRGLLDLLAEAGELVQQAGAVRDEQELTALREAAQQAIDDRDLKAIDAATERTEIFMARLYRRQPGWYEAVYWEVVRSPGMLPPTAEADRLVAEGRDAINRRDERSLEHVVQQMIRLLPRDEREIIIGLTQ
ncbi:molecular chaperone DnaK [Kribbella sp. VKM Ac-2569]|uniref:Hsp70 family protein n=1 Tax=Kribbella sp. VKM Ac-2569 TaxID=2512220 RepID=UPI00102B1444|nr:Hsp70 family protein [Kribbella sp. VKM Ac-2569]RZT28048.1 molecular chaperone DnaK [Kribbella sp. VKM Ac-2569]